MDTTISGDTKLPDNRTNRSFSLDGMWKDSLGYIGVVQAFGKVEILSGEPNLEVMAIQTNEVRDKFWVFLGEILLMFKLGVEVFQYS